jgi:RimJ/RimL family protein N-acetyltransferase
MLPISRDYPASLLIWEGLALRPLVVKDASEVLAALLETMKSLQAFLPFAHLPITLKSQVERIQAISHGPTMGFGLFQQGSTRLLAACGLHPRVPLNPDGIEIGFWTREAEQARGYACLMTRMLIIYAIEGLKMDRVQLVHNVENAASQKVIERCGFALEGRLRNALAQPSEAALAAGMSPCRDVLQYALTGDEARALDWYHRDRSQIRVFGLLGDDLGFPW